MSSPTNMVKKLAGMVDTNEVSQWENDFIKSMLRQTKDGSDTSKLNEKQLEKLEQVHDKFFSG